MRNAITISDVGIVRRHPVRTALVAIAVAAGATAVVAWRLAGTSDPVSEQDALASFRSAPARPPTAAGPRPGVYSYAAGGTETGGAGPFRVSRELPRDARLVVTSRPDGWEAELAYSRQHVESARYAIRGGQVRIAWRRTKVTFAGFGRDDRRTVDPPSLFLPADLAVGVRWAETYRTGDLRVRSDSRVLRSEVVDVGGTPVDAYVIAIRSLTQGPHPGTRTETLWWAPSLRLPVRWDVDMDIGGTFAFRARSTVRLRRATPAI